MTDITNSNIFCELNSGESLARITIDNQRRLNILDTQLISAISNTLKALETNEKLQVAILTGAGENAFIGGADIKEMAGLNPDTARTFISNLHRACQAIRDFPVPVIARIQGYCLGAGLEIAASCDLRVASEDSKFGMPEVRVGIPSVIEAALLPRLIGFGRARELVYTGDPFDAQQALEMGLVERVVTVDRLDEAINAWIESIIKAGPRAIRLQKRLIRRWEELPLDEAISAGIDSFSEAYNSDEPSLLMNRFLNRKQEQ